MFNEKIKNIDYCNCCRYLNIFIVIINGLAFGIQSWTRGNTFEIIW